MSASEAIRIDSAERALLDLLKNSLFGEKHGLTDAEQLEALEESEKQAVYCLAVQNVSLPEEQLDAVRKRAYSGIMQNVRVQREHSMLHGIMDEAGVPYVILKGAASALYYPQPELRMMGDVDFLVAPENVARATAALCEKGFVPWNERHICHIVLRRGKTHLELHFEPAGIPDGAAGGVVREYLKDAISSAALTENALSTFMNPSPFHHGLVMLLHMQHHLLSEGIGLRHLCDWAVFVDRFSDTEFRAMFENKLKEIGLWGFAVAISLSAHLGIGLPYRAFMGREFELAQSLLLDILAGGNFGKKDRGRVQEGMFISNRGKDGVRHGRIVQMILTVNQIVYTHWPICKKCRILLPFGWLYWGTVRACRVALGKRKPMHLAKAFRESQPRKELYKRLRLFEKEET